MSNDSLPTYEFLIKSGYNAEGVDLAARRGSKLNRFFGEKPPIHLLMRTRSAVEVNMIKVIAQEDENLGEAPILPATVVSKRNVRGTISAVLEPRRQIRCNWDAPKEW